jgi:hypothetical protein
MVKVIANESVPFFYKTLVCINPVVTEKMNLEILKVKLTYLLYFIIVHIFIFSYNIISINTSTTILIRVFLILLFSVGRLSIYVILLIYHNGEYSATSQLFKVFMCMSIRSRNPISEPANKIFSCVYLLTMIHCA